MKADLEDSLKLRKKLSGCIDPFTETDDYFLTGKITPASKTNIYDCVDIVMKQQIEFKTSLPAGFHNKIEQSHNCSCRLLLIGNVKNMYPYS